MPNSDPIDALLWQEDELRDEFPTGRIPLEKEGADIMYSVIGPEPKFRTQLIYQAAAIMNEAGCNWTMPATPGWDNSDMAMYTGDSEMMGRLKRMHFDTAACRAAIVVFPVGSHFDEIGTKSPHHLTRLFVQPTPTHNYCCAAGGGVINCGPPYKNARVESNRVKAEQLQRTGVKVCIAPCHCVHHDRMH